MKMLRAIFVCLALAIGLAPAHALPLQIAAGRAIISQHAPNYDTATKAVFAGMGPPQPSLARKALYATAITCLENAGAYSHFDRLGVLAAEGGNTNQAYVDLAAPSKHVTANGSGTLIADRGWKGDGTSAAYLDLGETLAAGGHFTTNAGTVGVWYNTFTAASSLIGDSNRVNFRLGSVGTSLSVTLNGGGSVTATVSASSHHLTANRTTSTNIDIWENGVLNGHYTTTAATGVSANHGTVGLAQGLGSVSQISAFYVGQLTDPQITATDTCLRPLLSAIGAD